MRKLLAALVLLASFLPALGAARYSEVLLAKESGSSRALLLRAANVYVYSPGASANCATTCSGTTVTVYDSSNIQPGDVVEVGSTGLTATVLTVPLSTTFTINTSLTWRANDRFLRTNATVTIYRDEGGAVPITQPIVSDTDGRVLFFVDTSVTTVLDIKAASTTQGLRYVNPGVAFVQTGASAGGWTDSGTLVSLSTVTDTVDIGGSGATGGRLRVYEDSTQAFTVASPTFAQIWQEYSGGEFWGAFLANNGMLCFSDGTKTLACFGRGTPQGAFFGDMANIDVANYGVLNAKTQTTTQRGIVIKGSTLQSANLAEFRDSLGNAVASVSPSGVVTGADLITAGNITGGTLQISGAAALGATTIVGLTTMTGDWKWDSLTYTSPNSHGAGFLTNDGLGNLSWGSSGTVTCYDNESVWVRLNGYGANSSPTFYPLASNPNYVSSLGLYIPTLFGTCAQDDYSVRAVAGMTVKNLYVLTRTVSVGVTFTLLKNCVDTTITCTVAFGTTSCTDVTHSQAFAVGDYLSLKATPLGSLSPVEANISYCWAR